MTLDQIVPWGRSYEEYLAMFSLTRVDLASRILGCGDGPAAFNAELSRHGGTITSIDPVYAFNAVQIKQRITDTYASVMEHMRSHQAEYVWERFSSVEQLGLARMSAMETFLSDFDEGRLAGRYVAGGLPALPFRTATFDLALSSHFLFLYSAQLTLDFHLLALQEMLRVSREVRVFPLLTLESKLSPHLHGVSEHFSNLGFAVDIQNVSYAFQRGGNEMLIIRPA